MKTQQTDTTNTEPTGVDALANTNETDAEEELSYETWVAKRERIRAEAKPYYNGLSLTDLAVEAERLLGIYLAAKGYDRYNENTARFEVVRDEIRDRSEPLAAEMMAIVRAALETGDVATFERASEIYRSWHVVYQRFLFFHHLYESPDYSSDYLALRDCYIDVLFDVAIQFELAEQEQEARQ
jgi:hypothetical protein